MFTVNLRFVGGVGGEKTPLGGGGVGSEAALSRCTPYLRADEPSAHSSCEKTVYILYHSGIGRLKALPMLYGVYVVHRGGVLAATP